jgi:hypothetical protein
LRTAVQVAFPDFWIGPITITLSPSTSLPAAGEVIFSWQRYKHVGEVSGEPTSFTFCRVSDDAPLQVEFPSGWKLDAYMGHDPEAVDANRDWGPRDLASGAEIFDENSEGWLRMLGKSRADFDRALGH